MVGDPRMTVLVGEEAVVARRPLVGEVHSLCLAVVEVERCSGLEEVAERVE